MQPQHIENELLKVMKPVTSSITKQVSVLVSGGVDSMVLLHLLNKFRKDLNISIYALHVVFKDMKDSEEVKELVASYCRILGVPTAISFSTSKSKEEAREAIKELSFSNKSDLVCTGHHLNDQIETIFFRFLRGSGPEGLRGMKAVDGYVKNNETRIMVKPLLTVEKHEIINYAKRNSIPYLEDKSNQDSEHATRNFIRHEVLPLVAERFNIKNVLHTVNYTEREVPNDIELYLGKWATKDLIRLSPESRVFIVREYLRKVHGFLINRKMHLTLLDVLQNKLKGFTVQINEDIKVVSTSDFVKVIAKN